MSIPVPLARASSQNATDIVRILQALLISLSKNFGVLYKNTSGLESHNWPEYNLSRNVAQAERTVEIPW